MADDATTITTNAAPLPAGTEVVNGKVYMKDGRGALVPIEAVRETDKLMDEMVRKIIGFAEPLSAEVSRFRQHTLDDFDSLTALLDQEYNAKPGGRKGNITFTSFDDCLKVQLQVADKIHFGPELQSAKKIVDECLSGWTDESGPELRAVVTQAFNVDNEGQVSQAEMYRLLRMQIPNERWRDAMKAIRESIRVVGSKRYVRFYRRDTPDGAWQAITIDVAVA